jgi:DNA end-binding protein Ku
MPRSPRPSRAVWSGTVTFGLVSIPVELVPATRDEHVALRMLAPDGTPLQRRYVCSKDGKPLDDDDLVRGFAVDGKLVPLSDDELERVAPEQSRDIVLHRFVPRDELPPTLFERGYFLVPGSKSTRAYHLLVQTMERTGRSGVATFVMHGKQHVMALFAESGLLRGEVLRFPDELRQVEVTGKPKVDRKLAARARKAVKGHLVRKLPAEMLHDEGHDKLAALIERKRKSGKNVIAGPAEEQVSPSNVIDLIELLRERIGKNAVKAS